MDIQLKDLIVWPDREALQKTMPECFKVYQLSMFVHMVVLGIARIIKYLDTHYLSLHYISIYEPGLFDSLVL